MADWIAEFEAERRTRAAPLLAEARGEAALKAPGGDFTLHGRADRIDRMADGRLAILDYKSGAPPSKKQVGAFAKQLPLLGAVAERGGFAGVDPAEVAEMIYVGLGSGGKTVEITDEGAVADAWEGLARLIASYDDAAMPYRPRLRPKHLKYAGDYDHLSRYGEWGDGGEDDE